MRNKLLILIMSCAACGDDGNPSRLDSGLVPFDAPEFAPTLTSFQATPPQAMSGVATDITWTWTFAQEPTFPTPTCSIDKGVGAVEKGQTIPVTITTVTTFTLTCVNNAGSTQRQVVVGVPPSPPAIATFTATPAATLTANAAGNVTFTWTYSNVPTPAPTCTVDGVGTVVSGQATSVTLPQARIFSLRCTNAAGSGYAFATAVVPVTECGVTAKCDSHATCTDTAESYTCACAGGYTGNGDVCLLNCAGNPSVCDANAPCDGTTCVPALGYVGSGAVGDATRAKIAFTTSTTFTGALGGLAGADAACNTAATNANLPGTYVAWLSDNTNDAFCRVQGKSGKKIDNCNAVTAPAAGPWVRVETAAVPRKQFAPTIDKLTSGDREVYYPPVYNENGVEVTVSQRVWTGTDENGVVAANTCNNWTYGSSTAYRGGVGAVHGGSIAWTKSFNTSTTDPYCYLTSALRCMEVGAGPALPPRHPTGVKRAFVTSVNGTGDFRTWADAVPTTGGLASADRICQSRARYAGYTNASNFKAWMSAYPTSLTGRITTTTTPYVRPDGVVLATSLSDMLDGKLTAAWNQTETNSYVGGNADTGFAWTGSYYYGSYYSSAYCQNWIYSSSYSGYAWRFGLLDTSSYSTTQSCSQTGHMYCVED